MSVSIMVTSNLKSLLDQRNIARLQAGDRPLSIRQVAQECGLPASVVSNMYANRTKRADYETLDRLCKYLHCQVGDILVYADDRG